MQKLILWDVFYETLLSDSQHDEENFKHTE